ncbi:MAG: hypothetical protein ACLUDG_00445 [Butyricicoccus sp.]
MLELEQQGAPVSVGYEGYLDDELALLSEILSRPQGSERRQKALDDYIKLWRRRTQRAGGRGSGGRTHDYLFQNESRKNGRQIRYGKCRTVGAADAGRKGFVSKGKKEQ